MKTNFGETSLRARIELAQSNNLETALRELEAANKHYMATPVWGEAGAAAKLRIRDAREKYAKAYEAANPGTMVI